VSVGGVLFDEAPRRSPGSFATPGSFAGKP
jgi:hypothetical protein